MPCRNPLCKSSHGRRAYWGFCARCRKGIRHTFRRYRFPPMWVRP